MTNTDKLKRAAERLGYEVQMAHKGKVVTIKQERRWGDHAEFNPKTDPAQLVECIEWLLNRGDTLLYEINEYLIVTASADYATGQTLAEAVINAIAGENE